MRRIFALLALTAFAGPAAACINDNELKSYEREFRSQYQGGGPPEPASEPVSPYVAGGAGGLLLVGATAVSLRRRAS
jgi:hypothetical protein